MCCAKKAAYSGLWPTCATSSRVLVEVNTCNKYPRPRYQHTINTWDPGTSIHSVKGEKQQEMQ
jgi:hypothetical protein